MLIQYFFTDEYNLKSLEYFINLSEEQKEDIKKIVLDKIVNMERAKTFI